jgi:hypothetical protein
MTLLKTLVLTIGGSIAKSLLTIWLKESPVAAAAATSIVDLVKSKTDNILAARKAEREFASLGDRIASSLEPVFQSYEPQEELETTDLTVTT